ncbi:hypothetical protein ACJX0J_011638 [Zea mays]
MNYLHPEEQTIKIYYVHLKSDTMHGHSQFQELTKNMNQTSKLFQYHPDLIQTNSHSEVSVQEEQDEPHAQSAGRPTVIEVQLRDARRMKLISQWMESFIPHENGQQCFAPQLLIIKTRNGKNS